MDQQDIEFPRSEYEFTQFALKWSGLTCPFYTHVKHQLPRDQRMFFRGCFREWLRSTFFQYPDLVDFESVKGISCIWVAGVLVTETRHDLETLRKMLGANYYGTT